VWAESYDRDLEDILSLQSELARAVAGRIGLRLHPPREDATAGSSPSVDPAAFEAYQKGRFHWYKLSSQHLDTALDYFQLALEKDPRFALAHEGIAAVWLMRSDAGFNSPRETILKAKTAATQALLLDDTIAEGHITLGNIKFCNDWDWDGAEQEFQTAIRLNPNSADACFFYADFLISFGRHVEAESQMTLALDLDPFNFFFHCFRGWHQIYLRRFDDAIAQLRKTAKAESNFSSAHLGLWGAFYKKRLYGEALAAARQFFMTLNDTEVADVLVGGTGENSYRRSMASAADVLAARSEHLHVSAVRVARLYAHADASRQALNWLEKACDRRESPLVHLNVGWDWDRLRAHSRFRDLLRRIGLSPAHRLRRTSRP
jgi:serine/threonine-protein kinase